MVDVSSAFAIEMGFMPQSLMSICKYKSIAKCMKDYQLDALRAKENVWKIHWRSSDCGYLFLHKNLSINNNNFSVNYYVDFFYPFYCSLQFHKMQKCN